MGRVDLGCAARGADPPPPGKLPFRWRRWALSHPWVARARWLDSPLFSRNALRALGHGMGRGRGVKCRPVAEPLVNGPAALSPCCSSSSSAVPRLALEVASIPLRVSRPFAPSCSCSARVSPPALLFVPRLIRAGASAASESQAPASRGQRCVQTPRSWFPKQALDSVWLWREIVPWPEEALQGHAEGGPQENMPASRAGWSWLLADSGGAPASTKGQPCQGTAPCPQSRGESGKGEESHPTAMVETILEARDCQQWLQKSRVPYRPSFRQTEQAKLSPFLR